MEARALLESEGVPTRVVSVPSFELFLARPLAERRAVIGKAPAKVGIEAAIRMGWDSIIGSDAAFVGMTSFGASAPARNSTSISALRPRRWWLPRWNSCGRADGGLRSAPAAAGPALARESACGPRAHAPYGIAAGEGGTRSLKPS